MRVDASGTLVSGNFSGVTVRPMIYGGDSYSENHYLSGNVNWANVDDPELWVLTTRWQNVGAYRRALSSYDVKVTAVPLLSRAIDEPSAYEPLTGELNRNIPR